MGNLRDWSPQVNGVVSEERPSSSSSFLASVQSAIDAEYWLRAEKTTQAIIAQVQPTVVSEERRKAVIDYVQRLIGNHIGCEVFPFGSVPLKTYLPDGDIDLTAFGSLHVDDVLANHVCSVLEREDQNKTSEFVVKDVQLIRAEVKLVKCLVQNIVVDISFNQLGGLCTLCFLEQVDRLIGKDHLFKRSIILIKAWCYYESRILGAHHGLISTYALETLVLYVFHLFHSSLNGPLAVLYKFLDYFSKFDWENYGISLSGPIRISSLPEFVVETPENGGGDLLLSNDFLKDCVEMFSVPSRGLDTNSRTFPQKHLNIIDPLKENNNLGRSVSKGNFYRIRSAFTYGARKLGHILSQAEENIAVELHRFFSNTLDRHGSGHRPDVQDLVPMSQYSGFGATPSISGSHSCQVDQPVHDSESVNSSSMNADGKFDHGGKRVYMSGNDADGTVSGSQVSTNGTAAFENRFFGDARDLATFRVQNHTISNDSRKSASSGSGSTSVFGNMGHALDSNVSCLSVDNGEIGNCNLELKKSENSSFTERNMSPRVLPPSGAESPVGPSHQAASMNYCWSLESLHPGHSCDLVSGGVSLGNHETFNSFSDLCGDYDSHLNSLQHGRCCYEYALNASVPQIYTPLLSQHQGKKSWDTMQQSLQFKQNMISPVNSNGLVSRPLSYSMNLNGSGFGMEGMRKPRGTGTYFPNLSHYRDRSLPGSAKNLALARCPRGNGVATPTERNSPERRDHEIAHVHHTAYQDVGKFGFSEHCENSGKMFGNANGTIFHLDGVVEFGSFGNLAGMVPSPESCDQPHENSPLAQSPSLTNLTPRLQPKEALDLEQDRKAIKSYHLKDEDDFPPLSNRSGKR